MDESLKVALQAGLLDKIQTLAHINGVKNALWDTMRDQGIIELQAPKTSFHVTISPEAIEELISALHYLLEERSSQSEH